MKLNKSVCKKCRENNNKYGAWDYLDDRLWNEQGYVHCKVAVGQDYHPTKIVPDRCIMKLEQIVMNEEKIK